MKFVGVREAQRQLSGLVQDCQAQGIVLTRHGKPVALLTGVEGFQADEILLANDPAFRRIIAGRRRPASTLVSHEALRARAREELATYAPSARPRRKPGRRTGR